jgi:formate hydrogenlyase transcriptional activator
VATDAELVQRELRKAKLDFNAKVVSTREAFVEAIAEYRPDLILSDYSLPGFDGAEALALAKQQCPEVPWVFVSGAMGEELAIETLKQGATDYVLKQRLSRLAPSVRRALREAELHRARVEAETALRQSEERRRVLLEINNALVTQRDREKLFEAIARAVGKLVPVDRMSLALLDDERDVLQVYGLAGDSTVKRFIPLGSEFPRRGSHLAPVFDQKRPHICQDLKSEQRGSGEEELLEAGLRSYVAVPLIAKRESFATLNVASRSPNAYSGAEVEFLTEVGQQVALALANMLAYEEISRLKARLEEENLYLREEAASERQFEEIIGDSDGIRRALDGVKQVASTDATVLVTGETGTGKELIARAIHNLSGRATQTMVLVNCASLPAGLIESELFGHEKGAFTGALTQRIGRFELADKGTLFLDEIGDLPIELQAKLLRVLQEGTFERVGSDQTIGVDVRVIAATNLDLLKAVEDRTFREDLYYRLNVFPIQIPPLRERQEDIPLLVRHFVMRYANKMGKNIESIPTPTMDTLNTYSWPGNVRELQNVIERAVILCQGSRLAVGDWLAQQSLGSGQPGVLSLEDLERKHIGEVLEMTEWRVSGERGAARILGIKPTTLEARMKKLDVKRPE